MATGQHATSELRLNYPTYMEEEWSRQTWSSEKYQHLTQLQCTKLEYRIQNVDALDCSEAKYCSSEIKIIKYQLHQNNVSSHIIGKDRTE